MLAMLPAAFTLLAALASASPIDRRTTPNQLIAVSPNPLHT